MSPRPLLVLLTLVAAFFASGTAAAEGQRSKLDRVLREAARSGTNAQRVIVQVRPGSRAAVKRALQAHGDVVEADYPSLDGLAVTVHGEDLAALEANPSVLAVSVDADVTSFGKGKKEKEDEKDRKDKNDQSEEENRSSRRDNHTDGRNGVYFAPDALRASLGLDDTPFRGAGVSVAILDSGIEPNRDLAPNLAGFWDFTRGGIPTRAFDDYGHGTHVAGLIASAGRESSNQFIGVAPAVRLYGLKVLDSNGRGRASHVVKALEWIVANKRSEAPGAVKIDIVNLSLGHPIHEPAESDPLVRAVENAVRAGVVVVAATGNRGQDRNGDRGYAGITSPGNAPSAITVGAVDTKNTVDHGDDRIAYFSSLGPTWFDGFAKPDIVAPGVGLTSDAAQNSSLYAAYPQLRLGTSASQRKFAKLSGTSMAAAVATGVASLALEASRFANDGSSLTPNALKAVLQYTALPVAQANGQPYEALAQGAGQVNGRGALALTQAINTEMPVGQAWLRVQVSPFSVIDGDRLAWSRAVVWNDSVIRGSDVLSLHTELWDDNIVWGTGCDTDDAQCVATVWGAASEVENIVWGTGLAWANDLVWGNRVIGLLLDEDNIVWGTIDGLTEDNIVWGTFDGDNIVWGTVARRNDGGPVWGLIDEDNIVWGTLPSGADVDDDDDNIVWGTLLNATAGSPKGGGQ